MTLAGAAAAAGPTSYLVLVVLVTCSGVLLLRGVRGLRRSTRATPPVVERRRPPATRPLVDVGRDRGMVVPPALHALPPARCRAARPIVEDEVIAFGLALEGSEDPVAVLLHEGWRTTGAQRPEA